MTGFEPWINAAVAGLSGIISSIIKEEGTNFFTRLWGGDISQTIEQAIFDASKKYIHKYIYRHGSLKVLGMHEPINLDDIYTSVILLDHLGRKKLSNIEELEKTFRKNPRQPYSYPSNQKHVGIKVVGKTQFLMVLGAPGSGKTTFLRKMGLEALKSTQGKFEFSCIPVFLELKRLTEQSVDIKQLITNELTVCGFPNPDRCTQNSLEQGKLLILLDGLDEVPTGKQNHVITAIQDFVDQYDKNRYVASCRVAAYRHNFRRFTDVVIAEFADGQIERYIYNWFRSEEDLKSETAKRYWQLLQLPENQAAKELAHTPLLLTFLCLVYDRSQTILNNRSTLYRKALRILLEEWAAEKRILHEEIYQGLSVELEEILLAEIAFERFEQDRPFMSQDDLVDKIRSFLTSNLNAPQHLSGEKVLTAIAIQQGIFVERAENIYSFSHLTLQEYLTAKYIVDHQQVDLLIHNYFTNRNWREVFLLVAGSMLVGPGADPLLFEMSNSTQKLVKTPVLQALLQWVSRIVSPNIDPEKTLSLRAALFNLGLALIIDHERAIATNSYLLQPQTLDMARGLALARTLDLARFLDHFLKSIHANYLHRNLSNGINIVLSLNLDLEYTLKLASNSAQFLDFDPDSSTELAQTLKRACEHTQQPLTILNSIDISVLRQYLLTMQTHQPLMEAPFSTHQKFADELFRFLCQFFQLDVPTLAIGEEEKCVLESYLYMNLLMIECKDEAVRISPAAWQSVSSKILTLNNGTD